MKGKGLQRRREWEKERSLPREELCKEGEEAYLRKRRYKKQSAKVTTSGIRKTNLAQREMRQNSTAT